MKASERLRARRQSLGMTQKELSKRTGLSVSTISNYERSGTDRAYFCSLVLLSQALGMPLDEIM